MKCPNCYNEIRDGAKFCPHCGHKIVGSQPTQLVRPRADQPPPPVYTPPAAPPRQPPPVYTPPGGPAAGGPVAAKQPRSRQLSWPILAVAAAVLLLALGALWFFFLRSGGATAGVPQGDRVLYGITETADVGTLSKAVGVLSRDGDQTELAFDRDGIFVLETLADPYLSISPNGRQVSLYRSTDDGMEMAVVSTEGGAEAFSDPGAVFAGTRAFAPDSSAYAFTRAEETDGEERYTLVVVDAEGEPVGEWPDLVFSGFFSNGDRVLALRLDDEGLISDLVTVTLPDGQPERVASIDDSTGSLDPFIFDDYVYYNHDDELRRVDANGENATTIYRFQGELTNVMTVPGFDRLLVMEQSESTSFGDLYVLEPDGGDRVRLDEDVYDDPGDGGSIGSGVIAAGDRLAYTTVDGDALTLYVVNADGSDRRRLAEERAWLVFAFSPDGSRLAYIAGADYGQPGDLYVAELPDGEPVRLSRDAWSLIFSGDRLLYSTAEDTDTDSPESAVHSVTYDGDEDEIIFGPEDGLIRLISPAR